MNCAPILIQVYTRKTHFVNCVESLAKCRMADKSPLFIASDAPKTEKDRQAVEDIRNYCQTIKGFSKVEVLAYEKNLGALGAFEQAIQRIFSEYDTMIYTEDDNVFSVNFLEFINGGLNYYQNNPRVFAVCGYKHPFKMPKRYKADVFASTQISAWGFGVWKDKYLKVDWYPKDFELYKKKAIGRMSVCWLNLMEDNRLNGNVYGDALMEFHCLKNNMVNVFPKESLVQNHGNDGSGMHCGILSEYSIQPMYSGEQLIFNDNTEISLDIEKKLVDAADFPFRGTIRRRYLKIKRNIRKRIALIPGLRRLYNVIRGK